MIDAIPESGCSLPEEILRKVEEILHLFPGGTDNEIIAGKIVDLLIGERKNHNYLFPCVEVGNTSLSGKGIFAKDHIQSGEQVAKFGGNITHIAEWLKMPEEIRMGHIMVGPNFTIGSAEHRDIDGGDFFNHSCDPNCGVQGHLDLVAMKNINPNDEITFDYGTVVGGMDIESLMRIPGGVDVLNEQGSPVIISDCSCGSSLCRGKITGDDWKILYGNERYNGFFPHHVQKIISEKIEEYS